MAMLAEPRRKQKWTLNPRGKHWSEDSNKFGQKMLEKMGWSSGKGLGANLDGMTDHIRARYKNDQAGIGFSHDDRDKQWTRHQEGFNELLQKLQNGDTAETVPNVENELSGKSLELKSKQSRARVHYQKFTRGKDVNKYSTKDLANIFGKKDLNEKSEAPEKFEEAKVEPEEAPPAPVGSRDTSHGVMTIKGGSITDYFKSKMSHLGKKSSVDDENDSESDGEARAGFGFSSAKIDEDSTLENTIQDATKPNPAKYASFNFSYAKPEAESSKESEEASRKRKNDFAFKNPAFDPASPKNESEISRKRKSDFVFENPCLELGSASPEVERTPKRRKSEIALENGVETVSQEVSLSSAEKKKRKKKWKEGARRADDVTNEALSLEVKRDEEASSIAPFEVPRTHFGLANDALDLADETSGKKRVTFKDTVEYNTDAVKTKKKKNKSARKLDKFEVDNEKLKKKRKKAKRDENDGAFVNEAMDVEIVCQEAHDNATNERKSERAQKKRERRSNLETIAEAAEEERERVPEVVTLDESFVGVAGEILGSETPKKKKKKRKSKDATEVKNDLDSTIDISEENEDTPPESSSVGKKSKKEKKKEPEVVTIEETPRSEKKSKKRKTAVITCDLEEATEVGDLAEPAVAKKQKKKKNLSAVESTSMDKENVEVSATDDVETPKKSKKQKGAKNIAESEDIKDKSEDKCEEETTDLPNGSQSPWDSKVKKSKKMFKALFARSPVVHFAGSNINEIKGYGLDV